MLHEFGSDVVSQKQHALQGSHAGIYHQSMATAAVVRNLRVVDLSRSPSGASMDVQIGETTVRVEDSTEFRGIRITDESGTEIEIICANPGIRPSAIKAKGASLWTS